MLRQLRESVWWPGMAKDVKEYVKSCLSCAASVPTTITPPMTARATPDSPWQEISVDFKGPIQGYYLHVAIDNLSRWPEVQMVKSTKFKDLEGKLETLFSLHGIPEVVLSDNGPPYNSNDWKRFSKKMGFKTRHSTPEHPESNGIAERFMSVLVKVIHTAVADKQDPRVAVRRRLLNYRNTVHPSTGKTPAEVLVGRTIRTRIPTNAVKTLSVAIEEAKEADRKSREERKNKFDKKRNTKEENVEIGDSVLVKQKKSVMKPPFDPNPYKVQDVSGTRLTLRRGGRLIKRSKNKVKKIHARPEHLRTKDNQKIFDDFSDTDFEVEKKSKENDITNATNEIPSLDLAEEEVESHSFAELARDGIIEDENARDDTDEEEDANITDNEELANNINETEEANIADDEADDNLSVLNEYENARDDADEEEDANIADDEGKTNNVDEMGETNIADDEAEDNVPGRAMTGRPKRTIRKPVRYDDYMLEAGECGICLNCRDKTKRGGSGRRKKACISRFQQ